MACRPARARRALRAAVAALLLPAVTACAQPTPPPAPPPVVETIDTQLDGRAATVELHHPTPPARDAVILAHGFTRSRATMREHAAALAAEGVLALAPDLPYFTDSRGNARALAELVAQLQAGRWAPPVQRVVLVGFSAGGLASLLAAGAPGVVGYVGLDPFDRPGGVGRDFARTLRTPVRLLRAGDSACNAFGIAAPWAGVLPNLQSHRVIEGASHCDFEAPTDAVCTLVCGRTDPARQAVVRAVLIEAVRDWLRPAGVPTAAAGRTAP